MKNRLNKNQILNILALFFGGIFSIPVLAIVCIVIISMLSEFAGINTNVVMGSTVISSVTHEVSFGPLMVICSYMLGMCLTYVCVVNPKKKLK